MSRQRIGDKGNFKGKVLRGKTNHWEDVDGCIHVSRGLSSRSWRKFSNRENRRAAGASRRGWFASFFGF